MTMLRHKEMMIEMNAETPTQNINEITKMKSTRVYTTKAEHTHTHVVVSAIERDG